MEFFSEYLKQGHFLKDIDARLKLSVALCLILLTISYKGVLFPAIILSMAVLLCLSIKVPFKVLLIRFSEPLFIAVVLVLIKAFSQGQSPLFTLEAYLFSLTLYGDGLYEGLLLSIRILAAVSIVVVLGFAMPFTEFMAALAWFRVPHAFVEVLMFAYRYIFVLLEEALVIYTAQKNRLGYSSIKSGLNSFGILTGSLTLKAFEQSQNTATSMLQRGFQGDIPLLKNRPFDLKELVVAGALVTISVVIWKL